MISVYLSAVQRCNIKKKKSTSLDLAALLLKKRPRGHFRTSTVVRTRSRVFGFRGLHHLVLTVVFDYHRYAFIGSGRKGIPSDTGVPAERRAGLGHECGCRLQVKRTVVWINAIARSTWHHVISQCFHLVTGKFPELNNWIVFLEFLKISRKLKVSRLEGIRVVIFLDSVII